MTDREKVIKRMEHCIGDNCYGDKWSECEYSGHGCIDALLEDTIALLKAQEPRVMTIDELRKLQQQDVVWLEDADKEAIIPGIVITALKKEWQFMTFTGYSGLFCVSCVDYGKRWRCWTSRPTDEQREAIPWN